MPHTQVRRTLDGQTCDGPPKPESPKAATNVQEDAWIPPEIPCTILPRLHWEGSDPVWNKEAIQSLKDAYKPDEVIDGFDWHVILRFHDVNRCENVFMSLERDLKKCKEADPEKCRTHKYVKAIEYV